ncbi:MFS transporter [Streptosporangium canum]|uniref:MFS transporter n=1 Tax=Streptosporangium canum TaxID=324952 RepID=UPI0034396B16
MTTVRPQRTVSRKAVRLLATAYGLTIANLYYCQPLLTEISRSLGPHAADHLIAVGQLGYALALILIVPLGDIVPRRPLLAVLLCSDATALALTAAARTAGLLLAAGALIGLTTAAVVNTLIPYAAALAAPDERGRAIGTMLTGGLTGVLLSRTVAGLVSQIAGWRALFAAAAVVTMLLAVVLTRIMPPAPSAAPPTEQTAFASPGRHWPSAPRPSPPSGLANTMSPGSSSGSWPWTPPSTPPIC